MSEAKRAGAQSGNSVFEAMGKHRAQLISEYLSHMEGARVLDLGAGRLSEWYGERRGIVRVDLNRGVFPDVVGDAQSLPFSDAAFDFVIATEIIEHVRYPSNMLTEIHRVLVADGLLFISTPNAASFENRLALFLAGAFIPDRSEHVNDDVGHIHFFDPGFLRRMLVKSGFSIENDLSAVLHLGSHVLQHPPRIIPRSMCDLIVYLARKE